MFICIITKISKKTHFRISFPWNEVSKSSVFSDFKHCLRCVQKAKTIRKNPPFKKKPCPCGWGLTTPPRGPGHSLRSRLQLFWMMLVCPPAAPRHISAASQKSVPRICACPFFLKEADRSCIQNTTPTCRFWIYSTIKVKNINNSTQTMKRKKKKTK